MHQLSIVSNQPRSDDLFDQFWANHPRKQKKVDARKAWDDIRPRPTPELVAKMIYTLSWQRMTPGWLKNGGEFIPLPATWIRGQQWDDEPMEIPQVTERNARSLKAIYGE